MRRPDRRVHIHLREQPTPDTLSQLYRLGAIGHGDRHLTVETNAMEVEEWLQSQEIAYRHDTDKEPKEKGLPLAPVLERVQ